MTREVWVTGLGAVTAAGDGVPALAEQLTAGRPAVTRVKALGGIAAGVAPGAEVGRAARRLDRSAAFFLAACREAWRGAGLEGVSPGSRGGIIEGSSLGPMSDVLEDHLCVLADPRERGRPSRMVRFMTGAGGALFAQEVGIRGPVYHLSAGSVSATCAIGDAFERIASGAIDLAVAGGGEAPLHPEILATFAAAGVLGPAHDDPPCRPFDARRNGTVLGEGAGALVLEAADSARARGARPLARITGYGFCTEAFDLTAPDPQGKGVVAAARIALCREPGPIGWVKAHGTGTAPNDAAESRALAAVLGNELENVPVVSLKSTLGHCLGASGAVEAVAAVIALRRGVVPGTAGFEQPDPALPPCRVSAALQAPLGDSVLLLSESFGGRCAALVFALGDPDA